MKKLIYTLLLASLSLASCKKDYSSNQADDSIIYKGEKYSKTRILELMSKSTRVQIENLVYDNSKEVFSIKGYDIELKLENHIDFNNQKQTLK